MFEAREQKRASQSWWQDATRSTRLTASIFELASGAEVAGVQASPEGHLGVATLNFLLWVGWVHSTESSSSETLGAEVARAIRGKPPRG